MDPAHTSPPTGNASGSSSTSGSGKGLRNLLKRRTASSAPGHSAGATGGGEAPQAPDHNPHAARQGPGPGTSTATTAADPPLPPYHSTDAHMTSHHVTTALGAPSGGVPDPTVQRLLVEGLLDRPFVEGEIWYTVLMDWLNQWKRHVGLLPPRKHYHHRQSPGPITTSRPFSPGYSAAKVPADAWRILMSCYGLAEGHKIIKQVAYTYGTRTEIENNLNTFDLTLGCRRLGDEGNGTPGKPTNEFDPSAPCHLVLRLSKMEKAGHVEWRARQLYHVPSTRATRLWGKTLDSDTEWRPLFRRDAALGRALELESDFVRSSLLLEVADDTGAWVNTPEASALPAGDAQPNGRLVERSIFDDVTSSWENEVHQQIDRIGKTFVRQVHGSLAGLMARARDFVADREGALREQERALELRGETLDRREELLARHEADLAAALREHAAAKDLLEQRCGEHQQELDEERKRHLQEIDQAHWRLQQAREELERERQTFQSELQRMSELNAVQESRVKLDIGGAIFMTSRLTLTRDPDSMLAAMFSGRHQLSPESDGSFFIDRDGTHFRYVLNFLRDGGIKDGTLPQNEALWRELYTEAEYYQIVGLQEYLQGLLTKALASSRDRLNRRT